MQTAATLSRPSSGDLNVRTHLTTDLAVWDRVLDRATRADAAVIDLDAHRAARRRDTRNLHLRRRLGVVLGVLGLAIALVLLVGGVGATADLERPAVSGQVVLAPGDTLWEVATQHAPAGVDARVYLEAIQDVNGFATADVPAWTTVLLPAATG